MRKARDFWAGFDPQSMEDFMTTMAGPNGAYLRQVLGYWEMAASLVLNGAIDKKMFQDSTSEYILVFAKLEALLPQMRERFGNPELASHLEKLTMSLPNAREKIDGTLQRIRAMMAARQAAGAQG